MATIEYEVTIHASPEFVYEVSQDYSVRYLWDPFPEKIELLHGATSITKGTKVFVLAKSGLKMEVEFVQHDPPTTAAIKMIRGPFFLQSFAGSWVFKPTDSGSTRARFVYSIKAKKWALPFITDRLASWYFSSAIRRRLNGLKAYCEAHA
jgi:Polyketide cyclase / dehydrase and lipid transport